VLSVQCSRDIDFFLSRVLYQSLYFTLKPLGETLHKGGPARKYDVAVQVDAQILIAKLDSISCDLCDTALTIL
jgi:hypothetical protein